MFLTIGIIIAFYAYGEQASRIFIDNGEATLAVVSMLILYGASCIPISYIYSFAFDNHSTAQITIMTLNFFTGFVMVMAYYIMISIPATEVTGRRIVHFFRIFPPYNIGEGLINISAAYFQNNILDGNVSYLAWEVTGRNIAYMAAESVVYFSIILLSEAPWPRDFMHFIERYLSHPIVLCY
jgi:ATP-binding cassette, subfamily A (ABC1), member 3